MTAPNNRPSIENTLQDHVKRIRNLEALHVATGVPGLLTRLIGTQASANATFLDMDFTTVDINNLGMTTPDGITWSIPAVVGPNDLFAHRVYGIFGSPTSAPTEHWPICIFGPWGPLPASGYRGDFLLPRYTGDGVTFGVEISGYIQGQPDLGIAYIQEAGDTITVTLQWDIVYAGQYA